MTNRKSTKRALFTSVISLLICCSMMIGTTFAWFTDSVVSGSNVIKTGNLDLEVEYTLDGENWKNLDGANDLFQKGLWEPGHTEVVALRIKNVGSLALKYVANMNILNEVVGKNETGGNIVLSEILTVSTLTQATNDIGEIALMLAYMGENSVAYETTASFKAGNVLRADQELFPGDAHYLFIKVDMAETVGNEANHDGVNVPSIEFGINVLATQKNYENDSFGNQYDKEAEYDDSWNTLADTSWYNTEAAELTLTNAYQLAGLAKLVNTGVDNFAGKTVKLANNVDLENKAWRTISGFAGNFDGNGKTVSNLLVVTDSSYAGLFGLVASGASVSNLTVNNAVVKDNIAGDDTTCYGAVVGYCPGAATFKNVTVTGNININGDWYVGGIVGRSNGSTMTNCSVIGADGSVVSSGKWAGGLSGYDNGKHVTSQCQIENITVQSKGFAGGLLGLSGKYSTIHGNTVKNVEVILADAPAGSTMTYGAIMGGACVYNWDNSYFTAYDNTAENVTCVVNGEAVEAREMGTKYPEGNDYGLVKAVNMRVGDVYFTSLKAAIKYAAAGEQVVIELLDDTIVPSNFKPEVAKNQNILIKTNGYDLLWVKVDTTAGKPNTDENGNLITTVITAENMSSYITIKNGGTLVIE